MRELWHTRRGQILAGGAALLLILLLLMFLTPQKEHASEESDIAFLRITEVLAAHPAYERLVQLRAEERMLSLRIEDMPAAQEVTPPDADPAPFDDSVWQKNAQTVIGARVALERERKRLMEVYAKETEADYKARSKAIDDEYLIAILNLNLKIDNQRAMHGLRVSEEELARERAGWEQQLDALKTERGARQIALYNAWRDEIAARVAARIEPQEAAWTARAGETVAAQKAEADRLRAAAEERGAQMMKRAQEAQEARSAAAQRALRLAQVRSSADALEEQILRDVRSRAAKLALMHKLSLILAAPEERAAAHLPGADAFAPVRRTPLVSVTARDITAEMVQEMQSIKE